MAQRKNPGRFDSRLTELVYELSLDGGPDEEAGSAPDVGLWAGLMRDGRNMSQALHADSSHYHLTVRDAPLLLELEDLAGVILTENDQGFVAGEGFEDGEELEERWEELAEELSGGDEDN